MKIILYLAIFLSLSVFTYSLIKLIVDLKKKHFFENVLEKFKAKEAEREVKERAEILLEGEKEDKRLITKIDALLNRSRIKTVFPFLTAELFLIVLIVSTLVIFGGSLFIKGNVIKSLIAAGLFASLIFIILSVMSKKIFNEIEKEQIGFINILKNLSVSDNNIISIFEKSITFLKEPLKSYAEQFVIETKNGTALSAAFKNFQDKVENKKLKDVLKNLDIASRHAANYQRVLDESRIIFKHYNAQKIEKKLALRKGEFGMALLMGLGIVAFMSLSIFAGQNLFTSLMQTTAGNIFIAYFAVVFIYTILKFISLDKLSNS